MENGLNEVVRLYRFMMSFLFYAFVVFIIIRRLRREMVTTDCKKRRLMQMKMVETKRENELFNKEPNTFLVALLQIHNLDEFLIEQVK